MGFPDILIPLAGHLEDTEDLKPIPSFRHGNETHLYHVTQASVSTGRAPDSRHSRQLHQQEHAAISQETQQMPQSRKPARGSEVSAGAVFVLTILMASMSCLGAVPFFFVGTLSTRWSALANAIACGVMLAASFDLVHEGEPYGAGLVIIGITVGEAMPLAPFATPARLCEPLACCYTCSDIPV